MRRASTRLASRRVAAATTPTPAVAAKAKGASSKRKKPAVTTDVATVPTTPVVKAGVVDDLKGTPEWHRLCSRTELSCALTLASGQTFTWQQDVVSQVWTGVVGNHVFRVRERDSIVEFSSVHPPAMTHEQARKVLERYFRLDMESEPLYTQWTAADDKMAQVIKTLRGHRLVRQDPSECLFTFICSSNNNIQRITQMVDKIKHTYGTLLCRDPVLDLDHYAFPTCDKLAATAEEATLRALGFGYRAPFIIKTCRQLQECGGDAFLAEIRDQKQVQSGDNDFDFSYQDALMQFAGIGRKVADCVGLFSLERLYAIPVDTHVWQIACREFDASLKSKKSMTPTIYKQIGDHFRTRFSPHAGWAHSVLFTGDLAAFQDHLPSTLQKSKRRKPNNNKEEEEAT
ncbi:TPA: hypothetical protein N0F65_000085 [Lagenidium giganteum]|uniref:DNA-(apurinic or apyrimidinic site) lyase n=1 Tax=Lagenidium giganteum TaxID=4803 RepID=A0AAV2YL52_9STRA|nr:TPA: hypothetical protein N0F65_000085 [Lagenidium giganteum]